MSGHSGDTQFHTGIYYGREKPPARDWGGRLPVALVFAQPARTALSTLGWQVVWQLLADHPTIAVERFFWEGGDEPPTAYDTDRPLTDFPVIAFSLNFEEEIRSLIQMLDRAGITVRSKEREGWPLVLAGGPLAFLNPATTAPAVDLFWVGEAEAGFDDLLAALALSIEDGVSKDDLLDLVASRLGVYVPGRSEVPVRRVLAPSTRLSVPGHSCFVSPEAEFRDMFLLEVNRGCPYGCRFCAAGYIYRPPRHADVKDLKQAVENANPKKVGLVGTALTDWPDLYPFLTWLHERGTKFSLASLRADGLNDELLSFLRRTGTRSLTLALEGASRRLRESVNKCLDEEVFLDVVRRASALQFNHLKIYLIVGWPEETDEDYAELGEFLQRMREAIAQGRGNKKKGIEHVTVSASCLVPKPWTPFQWAPMATEKGLEQRMRQIRALVKPLKGVRVMLEKPRSARLQGLLARGDDAVFDLAEDAAKPGMTWKKALKRWDGDLDSYLDNERDKDEPFVWESIDTGVRREYLWKEWEGYKARRISQHCGRKSCQECNACGLGRWDLGASDQD